MTANCPRGRRQSVSWIASKGAFARNSKLDFSFSLKIARVNEKPRVTHPFSDEAWSKLDALGERVDADLSKQDVRLTIGGEPTFVSIDDYQSAEWNTAALGDTKREVGDKLIRRLRDRISALDPTHQYIDTVRGHGIRLDNPKN